MSARNNSNQLVNPAAMQAMDKFKLEAAQELNVSDEYKSGYWGNMTSRECGSVGGQMVKKMIQQYEDQLAGGPAPQNNQNMNVNDQEQEDYNLAAKAGSFEPQQ
ncbi:MAG: alpha/beta-type small acid-soluble spore protein [Halanaerobacter sp.]